MKRKTCFHIISLSVAAILCICATGCNGGSYTAEKSFNDECWIATDTLFVEWNYAGDSLGMTVDVTFDPEYDYSNLYLRLVTTSPSGKKLLFRTTRRVIDPEGNWTVKAAGGSPKVSFDGFRSLSLEEKGTYRLGILHDMREDRLCGVKKVGIRNYE